ncbi:ribonuclease III [candidate division WWE3 bacterium RIFOXYC1_FULL_40_10]|uniref:Ribonuclease 3 n=1 Tax=candidate division WWE3 bacterium RIFOXYA2_FULL_46_9 TaxID=1802636 RepID=A0A1F4W218_UNCKA|nr:MAG: ribonuclease III [candidate division WWE3 bacterium RIFOXYB1_FULL_40_22]OGC61509.1 MAG: ribonuclease III [candidate division WWE3 bacterium RIFOXYA1_FULL_40_11]OGC63441.1 MAG: ribonuclease III [candidate division WWE3 bacterium RIFOXYA2_FULL_46_9]OGC64811.1 MAG: ribonuclease III [candidate division WWE3 bacterium RIFOXYB2_FULL_41_6]OGC65892.1 MAG: ribonuclease III [candidate division WWE3 bacterium RIFOXYC1_FULL_40_10]OGC67419.1 MAG: ribonuclease III [candidate division WWE3 bacterium 
MAFDLEKASQILGTNLKNTELFTTAFTHRSYLNEHPSYENTSNERLEFLGDAVLQLLSSEYLFNNYPNRDEGDLTNYRSSIVCTSSLGAEAKRLGYGGLLLMSNGEEATGGRDREYILANTFEAVLGALFIEKGIEDCRNFVTKELFYKIAEIIDNQDYKDSKSSFQEIAQEKFSVTPAYKVLDSWGPDHEKQFRVGVYLNDKEWGIGEGKSKQKAEQAAATAALEKIER